MGPVKNHRNTTLNNTDNMVIFPKNQGRFTMKLIHDENEVKKFFDLILPSYWETYETAFISIAARKKYLPEGTNTNLGKRPQMLDRDIIKTRDFNRYLAGLYRFTEEKGYTDAEGVSVPDEAKVFYANIYLSDSIAAYETMKSKMAEIDREIMSHAITGHNDITHALGNIRNLHGLWYTIIQNTYSRKLWIDYDIDIREEYNKEKLAKDVLDEIDAFAGNIVKKHAVITHGGTHILLAAANNGTAFSKEFNPETLLKYLQSSFDDKTKEIIINRNGMIPLPGTMQGGFPVHFIC